MIDDEKEKETEKENEKKKEMNNNYEINQENSHVKHIFPCVYG